MAKVGRPPLVPEVDMPLLLEKFERYIQETEIPIIAEFAYQNGFGKQYFQDREEFSFLIKKAIAKKEAALERGALIGAINPAMAIFSLKQLGWRDKQQVEHDGNSGVMTIVFASPEDDHGD
ncbi:hypothetical protein PghCCS26_62730 [Paenibacillus glycanilyticus]|uniref:Terminase n=1 Tax=Paenibacillus glycanilyticus TaxID=126569 RepID=A0ABQ6NWA2_9BACL|nr:terminase small subunit [Paenibacillus glycanilyticus]GMK49143.1 hypothetical protein PghCCS26_62730 [Paenibacillus glycanilyticus]